MNNYYEVSKGILNMVKNTNSKEIIVPNGILEIGENAFKYCPNVTKIYLPNTLKKIGSYAFSSCKLLQDIIIPNSVTEIEKRAFFQCSGLVSIVLPIKLYTIKDETFYGCSQLKTVIIQQNLVKIGKFAFGDCSSLISIDFPENLEIIEFKAFFQCTSLRKLILPNNLKTIHYTAFNGCTSLEEVLLFENTKKFRYIFPKHIKIKSDISIEQAKFLNTALNIGISEDVFNQISIDINYTIINISICTRGLIIDTKENKYLYNTKLHKLLKFIDIVYCTDIPYDYAKNILDELCYFNRFQLHEFNRSAQGVFKNSYVKKEVLHFKEPNQFSIDDNAFANMNELIWMYLNKPLEKIGYRAFYNCPDLKRIYMPDSIINIEDNAFEMCKNLEYIHMPNYIEHIGKNVFKDCDNLYILGYRDSIAEKYAKEYGIRFADIYKDIYNLKEYLSMMKFPREILMETNININKACKYDIKNVEYDMIGLIINTSKEQYLLDNITHELFMFI